MGSQSGSLLAGSSICDCVSSCGAVPSVSVSCTAGRNSGDSCSNSFGKSSLDMAENLYGQGRFRPERRPKSVRPQAGRRSSLRSPRRKSGKIFWGSCRLLFQPGRLLGCSHPASIHSRTQENMDLAAAKWWRVPVIGSGRRRPCTRCGNPVLRLGRTGQSGSQRLVFVSLTTA